MGRCSVGGAMRCYIIETPALSLGVDPGIESGAAVWVDGDTVTRACAWLKLKRKGGPVWRMDYADRTTTRQDTHPTLARAMASVGSSPASYVAVEMQYHAPRGRKGPGQKSAFVCAHTAGLAWALLCPSDPDDWPLATNWRTAIGASGLDAKQAEAVAWEYAYRSIAWPGALGDWFEGLTMVQAGAVSEAAVMAVARPML